MPNISVSYRRGDAEASTGRIFDRLIAHYGKDAVSGNVGPIPAGVDYRAHVSETIGASDVLLAIIGPQWLGVSREGSSRINDELDSVSLEVATALRRRIPLIPVLVGNARMPNDGELPPHLKDFAFRNALKIDTGTDFDYHMDRLIRSVDGIMAASSTNRRPMPRKAEHVTAERPIPAPPPTAPAIALADAAQPWSRSSPEFWLNRVTSERKLAAGDQPLIVISFASEDQKWVEDLRAFLDPKIELLQDAGGDAYRLWNFSDAKRGTTPGDEFPEIVAEKMWRCRAALIFFSSSYFRSNYCRSIELPFLMWRREHHKLMCLPLKLGVLPVDRVRIPGYDGKARSVIIEELIDDRQAPAHFANSRYREMSLKQLREAGIESEIESRFEGISRRVADALKQQYGALECD